MIKEPPVTCMLSAVVGGVKLRGRGGGGEGGGGGGGFRGSGTNSAGC